MCCAGILRGVPNGRPCMQIAAAAPKEQLIRAHRAPVEEIGSPQHSPKSRTTHDAQTGENNAISDNRLSHQPPAVPR
jgi:hypothetical protein